MSMQDLSSSKTLTVEALTQRLSAIIAVSKALVNITSLGFFYVSIKEQVFFFLIVR